MCDSPTILLSTEFQVSENELCMGKHLRGRVGSSPMFPIGPFQSVQKASASAAAAPASQSATTRADRPSQVSYHIHHLTLVCECHKALSRSAWRVESISGEGGGGATGKSAVVRSAKFNTPLTHYTPRNCRPSSTTLRNIIAMSDG